MGISTRQVTVTTAATALVDATQESEMVYLHSSSGTCFVGNSDVTSSTGYKMDNGDKITIENKANGIWAITNSGTVTMQVMAIGK
jgi:formylmethanofuran dehydrogenase subunit C